MLPGHKLENLILLLLWNKWNKWWVEIIVILCALWLLNTIKLQRKSKYWISGSLFHLGRIYVWIAFTYIWVAFLFGSLFCLGRLALSFGSGRFFGVALLLFRSIVWVTTHQHMWLFWVEFLFGSPVALSTGLSFCLGCHPIWVTSPNQIDYILWVTLCESQFVGQIKWFPLMGHIAWVTLSQSGSNTDILIPGRLNPMETYSKIPQYQQVIHS